MPLGESAVLLVWTGSGLLIGWTGLMNLIDPEQASRYVPLFRPRSLFENVDGTLPIFMKLVSRVLGVVLMGLSVLMLIPTVDGWSRFNRLYL